MRILIVEDEALLAFELQEQLEAQIGVSVVCVSSVKKAFRELERQTFDFAVLDINVTDGTTFDLARSLRSRGISFFFISGSNGADRPADLLSEIFLLKPCDYKVLFRILDRVRTQADSTINGL